MTDDRTAQALARLRAWPPGGWAQSHVAAALDCVEALAALYEQCWSEEDDDQGILGLGGEGVATAPIEFKYLRDARDGLARLTDAVLGPQGDADAP